LVGEGRMKRKILKEFLEDYLPYTFAFYGMVFIVLLFFKMQFGPKTEMLYPLLMVTFIYTLFMVVRAYQYVRFSQFLEETGGVSSQKNKWSNEQKMVLEKINHQKKQSNRRLNQLDMENNQKYLVISQIIHDIKTPTSVIDLMIQHSKSEEEVSNEILHKIQQENRLINDHLDQVLSYLRLDFFHQDYVIEQVDLVQQLRGIINEKKERFIQNQVFPKWMINVASIRVLTDQKWNGVLLNQIITNAIKYTAIKEGERSISFKIDVDLEKGNVYLIIEDTGIGIPHYDRKRVFEPFFTGENGRRVRNASGIGLHISKNIVESLNHKIHISSNEGQGTRVTLTYLTKM
jgi:two-component system, OmpR family, sensor histidine kinase YxdK